MQKDIEYLYSIRKYQYIILDFFILSLIIGLLISVNNPGLSKQYFESFQDSFGWIKTLQPIEIMFVIFLNNAFKSLLAMILGIGFAVVPILFVMSNGIILSMVADIISQEKGYLFLFASLLPHGILELPMILLSAGIGLRLGYVTFSSMKTVRTESNWGQPQSIRSYIMRIAADLRPELISGVRFFIRVILPLLFLAAFIETFVTPALVLWIS